jgi:hypothetical protein
MKRALAIPFVLLALSTAGCDEKKDEAAAKSEAKSDAKSETKSDAKSETKRDTKTDAKTEAPPAEAKAEPTPAEPTGSGPDAFDQEMIAKYGACEVSIEGAVTKTAKAPGGMSALGSDYFMNDDEMREAVKFFARGKPIEEAMKQDPRIYTLIVNCAGQGVSLNFLPGGDSKYADVPFGPKKYAIGGMMGAKSGEMAVMLSIDNEMFRVEPGGFLDVTKFDKVGLAGTFEFKAKGDKGEITVKGKIDYKCAHDTAACREGRGQK